MPSPSVAQAGLHALVLAAGASSRFGSPKALARLGESTLLEHALRRAQAVVGDEVTLILGANAELIRQTIALGDVRVSIHESWSSGLAESLKFAVGCIPPQATAALIMLLDQPAVSVAELNSLVAAWNANPDTAAAAYYAGDIGAPCILPRALFCSVGTLRGDRGAKPLLHSLHKLTRVPMASAEFDIDTPADLAGALTKLKLRDTSSV